MIIQDSEYCRLVRRFPPSALLPGIAAAAAHFGQPGDVHRWLGSPGRKYTPWALADAARVSIVNGNEHRNRRPSDRDLFEILNAYSQLDDPYRRSKNLTQDRLGFLLRMAGQQLIWQESDRNDLARTAAMFLHTSAAKPLQCLNQGWDTAIFGCSLADYIGITQLVWSIALDQRGWFNPGLLLTTEQAAADPMLARMPGAYVGREKMMEVIDSQFTASTAWLKAEDERVNGKARRSPGYNRQLRRYEYNPLRARPLVTGLGPWYLCPSPALLWEKATPWGIMLAGRAKFGNAFPPDVGHLFEQYIGRQLRLLPDATVHGEIKYRGSGGMCDSADWIVVFDDLVLIVEAKSILPTQPMRMGDLDTIADVVDKLAKAHRQIDTTAELIRSSRPEFAAIPADRPILGMAATLQPFHIANSSDHRQLMPATTVPMTVISATEVETLVTLDVPSVSRFLIDLAADVERSTWAVSTVMAKLPQRPNPILDQGWESYPWSSSLATEAELAVETE